MGISFSDNSKRSSSRNLSTRGISAFLKCGTPNARNPVQVTTEERERRPPVCGENRLSTSDVCGGRGGSIALPPMAPITGVSSVGVLTESTEVLSGGSHNIFVANLPTFVNMDKVKKRSGRGKGENGETFLEEVDSDGTFPLLKSYQLSTHQSKDDNSTSMKDIPFMEKLKCAGDTSARMESKRQQEFQQYDQSSSSRVIPSSICSSYLTEARIRPISLLADFHSNTESVTDTLFSCSTHTAPSMQTSMSNAMALKNAKAVLRKHIHRSLIPSMHCGGSSLFSSLLGGNSTASVPKGVDNINPLVCKTSRVTYPRNAAHNGNKNLVDSSHGKRSRTSTQELDILTSQFCSSEKGSLSSRNTAYAEDPEFIELMETSVYSWIVDKPVVDSTEHGSGLRGRRTVRSVQGGSSTFIESSDCSGQRQGLNVFINIPGEVYETLNNKDVGSQVKGVNGPASIAHSCSTNFAHCDSVFGSTANRSGGCGCSWVGIGDGAEVGTIDWYARLRKQCQLEELETPADVPLPKAKRHTITFTEENETTGESSPQAEVVGATSV